MAKELLPSKIALMRGDKTVLESKKSGKDYQSIRQ